MFRRGPRFRIPRFGSPIGDLFDLGLNWFLPRGEPDLFSWAPTNPAFVQCGVSCSPQGSPYDQGPVWGQNRNSAGCGTPDCSLLNQACPQGSASYSGSGSMGRTLSNRPFNCVSMHEVRGVFAGGVQVDTRCHVLAVWCAPDGAIGAPSYNPQGALSDPGRHAYIPPGYPDPYADYPPGSPQPAPRPVPYRWLPKLPDPDPEILPGGITRPLPYQQPWEWFVPAPGVVLPVPMPAPAPMPTPIPDRWVVPRPNPRPGPGLPWWPTLPRPIIPPGRPTVPGLPPNRVPSISISGWIGPRGDTRGRLNLRTSHKRAKSKDKEKKARMSAVMSAVWAATGEVTEILDLLDVLYNSFKCEDKRKAGMFGKNISAFDKAKFIYENFHKVSMREFVRGYLKNAFEDRVYGLAGKVGSAIRYGMSHEAGVTTKGGNPLKSRQTEKYESDTFEALDLQMNNALIEAYNAGIDQLLGGQKPKEFGCVTRNPQNARTRARLRNKQREKKE